MSKKMYFSITDKIIDGAPDIEIAISELITKKVMSSSWTQIIWITNAINKLINPFYVNDNLPSLIKLYTNFSNLEYNCGGIFASE
jgi:hypothetical protein